MPPISVVVASKVGAPFIQQCLESIRREAVALEAEVLVVVNEPSYAARVAEEFPWTRVVLDPSLSKVPAMRRRGVEEARGDLVAIIEEHCSAGEDWLHQSISALSSGPQVAAGGAISDYGYARVRDWVVYFCEYNGSLPPAPRGETGHLNDANIVYRRSVLLEHLPLLDEGYWPMTLHPVLLAKGMTLRSVPEMVVYHRGPFNFGYYLHQRFLFSKAFTGVRARTRPVHWRAAYLLGAPLMPLLLLARMTRTVVRKGHRVPQFLRALPLTIPALVVLVAGEWVGCLVGPGDALSKVE